MSASIPCPEAQAHLPLFVGGDLEAPLTAVVAEHLEGCPACAARREALDRARGALLGLAQESGFVSRGLLSAAARLEDLERDAATELGVEGRVHDSHAATADLPNKLILTNLFLSPFHL